MTIEFYKYHGNGNDFIIIDEWEKSYDFDKKRISLLCDRHFGIGADGLIRLSKSETADFVMRYYNSDGNLASMCGNGGRCIASFAFEHGYGGKEMRFEAYDGIHKASVIKVLKPGKENYISLRMNDVTNISKKGKYYFLDTGSPHYVEFVKDVENTDVVNRGKSIRYDKRFAPGGTNVNFVEIKDKRLFVRTYERGVENETLSCGTGVTAANIAAYLETGMKNFETITKGGSFSVNFETVNNVFENVFLTGAATFVFKGVINI
jgi:diaminopimelate epimerase